MKKMKITLLALLLVAAAVLASGCAKKTAAFRSGTWSDGLLVNYVFNEDGKSGKNFSLPGGTSVPFEYELNADGSAVFHMGGADDNSPATVSFSDDGNTATIDWPDGSVCVLTFVDENTSDEFASSYDPAAN